MTGVEHKATTTLLRLLGAALLFPFAAVAVYELRWIIIVGVIILLGFGVAAAYVVGSTVRPAPGTRRGNTPHRAPRRR